MSEINLLGILKNNAAGSAPAAVSSAETAAAEKPAEISFFGGRSAAPASTAPAGTAPASTVPAGMSTAIGDETPEDKKEHIMTEAEKVRDNYMRNRANNPGSKQKITVIARSVDEYFGMIEL